MQPELPESPLAPAPTPARRSALWLWLGGAGILLCVCGIIAALFYGFLLPDSVRGGPAWDVKTETLPPPGWKLVFEDKFAYGNQNHWRLNEGTDTMGTVDVAQDDSYRLDITASVDYFYLHDQPLEGPNSTDSYTTVDVEMTGAEGSGAGAGIVVRSKFGDFYSFQVYSSKTADGNAFIGGKWDSLFYLAATSALHETGKNTLGLVARGDTFDFYVNNQLVKHVVDDRLKAGTGGITALSINKGKQVTVTFTDFRIYTP